MDLGHSEIRSYATRAYQDVAGTEDGNDRTVTLRLLGDHTLARRGELRGSFTYSDIFHEAIVDGVSASYQQRLMSLAGETDWRLVEEPDGWLESLRLSLGGAWDRGTTPRPGGVESLGTLDDWGARLGFTALVNDGATALHAGVSRRGRFPALRATYSAALNRFVPNPDLHPEHLLAFEGGGTVRTYFGLRHISLDGNRFLINGRPVFQRLVLDQGFYPDGIYTAPTDRARFSKGSGDGSRSTSRPLPIACSERFRSASARSLSSIWR